MLHLQETWQTLCQVGETVALLGGLAALIYYGTGVALDVARAIQKRKNR